MALSATKEESKINGVLAQYGIGSVEECRDLQGQGLRPL